MILNSCYLKTKSSFAEKHMPILSHLWVQNSELQNMEFSELSKSKLYAHLQCM